MKVSFFHLWQTAEGVRTEGQSHYFHGNVVDSSNGSLDGPPNGVFAKWSWDGTTLEVSNCRYGMSPLFYFSEGDEFCVSNAISKLLDEGAPRTLDDAALAVFIRRGTFLGEDTAFKSIRALPPGARLRWRAGRMTLESARLAPKVQHLKPAAAVEGIVELFTQSIRRRLPQTEDFLLPLSGGKDSRHILLELMRQKARPKACVTATLPPPRVNQDLAIARAIAQRLEIPHVVLPAAQPGVSLSAAKLAATSFCTLDHGWAVPLTDYLERNTEVSYDGIGLDVFFNTIWAGERRSAHYSSGRLRELADDLMLDAEVALATVLRPEAMQRFSREKALDRMVEELAHHAEAPHPIASFQFWNRTRRSISTFTFAMQHSVKTVHTPFLDNDLFDFVTCLDHATFAQKTVHTDAISRIGAATGDIEYTKFTPQQDENRYYNRKLSLELIKAVILSSSKHAMIDKKQCLLRLTKSALTGKNTDLFWLNPELIYYFNKIEYF